MGNQHWPVLRKRKQLDSNLFDLLEFIVGLEPSYVVYVWYGFGESISIWLRMLMLYFSYWKHFKYTVSYTWNWFWFHIREWYEEKQLIVSWHLWESLPFTVSQTAVQSTLIHIDGARLI